MNLSRLKTLLALAAMVVTSFVAEAKMQTKEIIFSSTDIVFSSGTSYTTTIDGETATLIFSTGAMAGNNNGIPVNCPEGIDDAQKFIIPKKSGSTYGYLIMKLPLFKELDVNKVELETWVDGSNTVKLTVSTLDAAGLAQESFNGHTPGSSSSTTPSISNLTNYIGPMSYVPQNGHTIIENGLRLYYENQSSSSSVVVGLKSIKVTYDDGEPEDMELKVLLDNEPAVDGQLVEPGSVLTIDTGGVPNAEVAYKIGDASVDDLLPAEGLTLTRPGTFIYHFTATAKGYKEAHIDFTFTILGKIVVDTETIDLAQSAEKHGLTIFDSDSDEYETKNLWKADDIQFFFEPGQEIRMERQEDGEVMLMLNPGAELQVSLIETNDKILSANLEGLNTDDLEISILNEEDSSRIIRRAASWDAAGQRATGLRITNTGDQPAGISTLSLDVEKNIATGADAIEETESLIPEYYDLTGRKVLNPGKGLFVERKGNKARVVLKR